MKKLIFVIALCLTGCATPPSWLASMYDSNDRCQNYYKVENYKYPDWCGAGSGARLVTRDYNTGRYLTTTRIQQ
jgi:starvation-inducible outer membrane lipoprotein